MRIPLQPAVAGNMAAAGCDSHSEDDIHWPQIWDDMYYNSGSGRIIMYFETYSGQKCKITVNTVLVK